MKTKAIKSFMTFMLVLALLIAPILTIPEKTFAATTYPDVPETHWAYKAISKLTDLGIMKGYEDGTFRPNGTITYGEFVKMVVKFDCPNTTFTEKSGKNWAAPYWELLGNPFHKQFETKWFSPIGITMPDDWDYIYENSPWWDTKLIDSIQARSGINIKNTNKPITRVDMAALLGASQTTEFCMLFVAPQVIYKDYVYYYDFTEYNKLLERENIDPYILPFVANAVQHRLMKGYPDGTFKAYGYTTRAEAAQLIARALEYSITDNSYAFLNQDEKELLEDLQGLNCEEVPIGGILTTLWENFQLFNNPVPNPDGTTTYDVDFSKICEILHIEEL
jgi:hypothetical protein